MGRELPTGSDVGPA